MHEVEKLLSELCTKDELKGLVMQLALSKSPTQNDDVLSICISESKGDVHENIEHLSQPKPMLLSEYTPLIYFPQG